MRYAILFCAIALVIPGIAQADDRPFRLVCFEEAAIKASLDRVTNVQQFLRNDRRLQSGSCSFAQLPAGSTARFAGIHSVEAGFHYPIYRVTYATTGQRMFAVDGIFRGDQWFVRRQRSTGIRQLLPTSCTVLDGYRQTTGRIPRYMVVPDLCSEVIIE